MCSYIVNEQWYSDRKDNLIDDNERIVKAAAKLIAAQIRELECNTDVYPVLTENVVERNESRLVPPLLKTFMNILVSSKLKQDAIGECIVQAARPRSIIAPTLLGLGIEMHHLFASKYLIKQLSKLGFSVSYDEIIRFKQSSVLSTAAGDVTCDPFPGAFTQWVADNVDHNIRTLDGHDTFHGMGIISASASLSAMSITPSHTIPRLKPAFLMESQRETINYKNEIVGDFLYDSDLDWVDEEMFESDGTSSLIEKMQH